MILYTVLEWGFTFWSIYFNEVPKSWYIHSCENPYKNVKEIATSYEMDI